MVSWAAFEKKRAGNLLVRGPCRRASPVKASHEKIAANEKLKKQLEKENPGLLALKVGDPKSAATDPNHRFADRPDSEMVSISVLGSKIKKLTEQLDDIQKKATAVNEAEGPITELQKRKKAEAERYRIDSEHLEQGRIMALSAGKLWNIGVIQAPSPPFPAASKLYKMMAMVLFGSIAVAFALAFLIDHYLDRSLKRPTEVESKLGLPLFISIPRIGLNGKPRVLNSGPQDSAPSAEHGCDQRFERPLG